MFNSNNHTALPFALLFLKVGFWSFGAFGTSLLNLSVSESERLRPAVPEIVGEQRRTSREKSQR